MWVLICLIVLCCVYVVCMPSNIPHMACVDISINALNLRAQITHGHQTCVMTHVAVDSLPHAQI